MLRFRRCPSFPPAVLSWHVAKPATFAICQPRHDRTRPAVSAMRCACRVAGREARQRARSARPVGMSVAASATCCVCLSEDVRGDLLLSPLPCCGRVTSQTRCCLACLRRCACTTSTCPICRTPLELDATGAVRLRGAEPETMWPHLCHVGWRASTLLTSLISHALALTLRPVGRAVLWTMSRLIGGRGLHGFEWCAIERGHPSAG
jgi:hypothetical protein